MVQEAPPAALSAGVKQRTEGAEAASPKRQRSSSQRTTGRAEVGGEGVGQLAAAGDAAARERWPNAQRFDIGQDAPIVDASAASPSAAGPVTGATEGAGNLEEDAGAEQRRC